MTQGRHVKPFNRQLVVDAVIAAMLGLLLAALFLMALVISPSTSSIEPPAPSVPSPSETAGGSIPEVIDFGATWVEDHTGEAWPVIATVPYVDKFTGSVMRYGTCRTGAKCIRIYEKTLNPSWAGYTYLAAHSYYTVADHATIYVNPQRNGIAWAARKQIITHELGHAMGIWWHSTYCTNVMYSRVYCSNGTLPAYRFSGPQLARLAVN